jgi:DNA-binding MarR family transcriptional regulator
MLVTRVDHGSDREPEVRRRPDELIVEEPLTVHLDGHLVSTTMRIERQLASNLKRQFGSTLPRFDLLAQLDRAPDGLRMTELADRLLVTGGNVTWLVTSLAQDGLVTRARAADDKRAVVVQLTTRGQRHFAQMAEAHETWVSALFSALPTTDRKALATHLGTLKQQVSHLEDLS